MFILLLVVVYNVIASANSEIPVLVFETKARHVCEPKPESIIIMQDKPLHIRVNNKHHHVINQISCTSLYVGCDILNIENITSNNMTLLQVPNCGKIWDCELHTKNNKVFKCSVNAHYRTKEPTAVITLNDRELSATTSDLLFDFDAVAEYVFQNGENVIIECRSSKWVMLKYPRTDTMTPYLDYPVNMSLTLTKEYHNSFVDCTYGDENDTSVIRLWFYIQDQPCTINLQINNMNIEHNRSIINEHSYHEGEKTDIVCSTTRDDIYLVLEHYGMEYNSEEQSKVTYTVYLNSDHDNTILSCVALDKATKSNPKDNVQIKFVLISNDFYVTGLNSSKILQKHHNRYNSVIIHYKYTNNESLSLTCTSVISQSFGSGTQMQYSYYDGRIRTDLQQTEALNSIHFTFILTAYYNNTYITCLRWHDKASSRIAIKLLYTTPTVPDNDDKDRNNHKSTTETTNNDKITTERTNDDNEDNTENNITPPFWIGVGIAVLIIVIIIFFIAYIFMYKRNKRQPCEVNYMNLISNEDDPLSRRIQDTEPQYMELNHGNRESVHQYAEITPTNGAEVKKPDTHTYAQVMRKDLRARNDNNFENVSRNDKDYVNVSRNDKDYVNVSRNDKDYVNVSRNDIDYENLRARYVNSNVLRNGLVEPAYCELTVDRK